MVNTLGYKSNEFVGFCLLLQNCGDFGVLNKNGKNRRDRMALVKCKECGNQVSVKAKACPSCGAVPPKKTSVVTWAVLGMIVMIVFLSVGDDVSRTPEERAAEAKERQAEQARLAAKKVEDKRKGFHCLSSWDGSHSDVKKITEMSMRDPDSFEHIETRITPVSEGGSHRLTMKYRARNGFGGMTVGSATASIDNETCEATMTSLK